MTVFSSPVISALKDSSAHLFLLLKESHRGFWFPVRSFFCGVARFPLLLHTVPSKHLVEQALRGEATCRVRAPHTLHFTSCVAPCKGTHLSVPMCLHLQDKNEMWRLKEITYGKYSAQHLTHRESPGTVNYFFFLFLLNTGQGGIPHPGMQRWKRRILSL